MTLICMNCNVNEFVSTHDPRIRYFRHVRTLHKHQYFNRYSMIDYTRALGNFSDVVLIYHYT